MQRAASTTELMRLTGGRSVYSEAELQKWQASQDRPVKVINFLLAAYIAPPLALGTLVSERVVGGHPPQSIKELNREQLDKLLSLVQLGFRT